MSDVLIPEWLVKAYPPSRSALFDRLRNLIDSSIIEEISRADYDTDSELHFSALNTIWRTGEIPAPLPWEPKEVLELIRWSEPDNPMWAPGAMGRRGYLMRGFACSVLLLAGAAPENRDFIDGENSTLAQLLESAAVLEEHLLPALGAFLTWRIPRMVLDEERPFFALALFLTAIIDPAHPFDEAQLDEASRWVKNEEAAEATRGYRSNDNNRWLFDLTCYDGKEFKWKRMANRALPFSIGEDSRRLLEMIISLAQSEREIPARPSELTQDTSGAEGSTMDVPSLGASQGPAELEVRAATVDERGMLESMLAEYLAEIGAGAEYPYFPLYWSEPSRFIDLFLVRGAPAGFYLVRRHPDESFEIAEFYILPEYRRKGLGGAAAQVVIRNHPGRWMLSVLPGNDRALCFWRSTIQAVTGEIPVSAVNEKLCTVFHFQTGDGAGKSK